MNDETKPDSNHLPPQVLPHIVDLRVFDKFKYISQMFKEFNRILKPGGVLSINTCTHDQLSAVW